MIKKIFFILLFVEEIFCSIKTQSFIDKKTVFIGDYIKYTINFTYLQEYMLMPYEISSSSDSFILIKKEVKKSNKLFSKSVVEKNVFYLLSVELGRHTINSTEITFSIKNSTETRRIILPAQEINVVSIKKPNGLKYDGEIADIFGPVGVRNIFLFLVIILLLIGFMIWYNLFYKKTKIVVEQKPQLEIDYKLVALKKMDELWSKDYIEKGLIKEFYLELSEIVRWYLSVIYKINALELTSEELFYKLKSIVDKKYNLKLKTFLDNSDLAKFAKYVPEKKQLEVDFNLAKELIE